MERETIIIIHIIFTVANMACVPWMFNVKAYKSAAFNAFAAGACLTSLIDLS